MKTRCVLPNSSTFPTEVGFAIDKAAPQEIKLIRVHEYYTQYDNNQICLPPAQIVNPPISEDLDEAPSLCTGTAGKSMCVIRHKAVPRRSLSAKVYCLRRTDSGSVPLRHKSGDKANRRKQVSNLGIVHNRADKGRRSGCLSKGPRIMYACAANPRKSSFISIKQPHKTRDHMQSSVNHEMAEARR